MKLSEYLAIPKFNEGDKAGLYRFPKSKDEQDSTGEYPCMVFLMNVSYEFTTEIIAGEPVVVWHKRWRPKNEILDGP